MIHSVRFTSVLDTNAIYPVIIIDVLLWFAYCDLYTPKWIEIYSGMEKGYDRKGIAEGMFSSHKVYIIVYYYSSLELKIYLIVKGWL